MRERSWKHDNTYKLAAGFGAVAGLRSLVAPRYLSSALNVRLRRQRSTRTLEARLGSRRIKRALALLSAGELLIDKLPIIPARIKPLPLAGRASSGFLAGWVLGEHYDRPRLAPALVGAAAAVVASYAAYHLRRAANRQLGLPDAALAVAEDALVVTLGSRLASAVT